MSQAKSALNTKSRMFRPHSGSDSDPSFSGESSDDSPRGTKRSLETQQNYEGSKRTHLDFTTIKLSQETMEDADSLFGSQSSFRSSQQILLDDLISLQPESLSKGLPVCEVTASGTVFKCHPVQPSARADTKGRDLEIQGEQHKPNKRIAKGRRSELSSQETCSDKDEFSEREKQKALNRQYARDSRERKNQKMYSLEKANINQRSVIQIYTKAIAVFYKRLHGGEEPNWANHKIPWYNSKDGKCGECQIITCLLPIEDDTFYDELGNNTLGKIIEKKSDTEILISGSFSTCKTVPIPAHNSMNISHGSRFLPPVQRGYGQNPPTNVDSRDSRDDRQTRSENTLPILTPVSKLPPRSELIPEVYEKLGRNDLNSLHEASSHTPIVSNGRIVITLSQKTKSDVDNPSFATKSTENARIATATRPVNVTKSFNGDNYIGATPTSCKPCSIVAPVNMPPDITYFTYSSAQKYVASNGNDLNIYKPPYVGYMTQSENEAAFRHQPDDLLMPSLSQQSDMFDSVNGTEEPTDSQCASSVEDQQEDILEVENLQSSLETA